MNELRIEETAHGREVANLRAGGASHRCLFYQEEVCCAPRLRFRTCRRCVRINPHAAARNLLDRIKELAVKLFNLQAPTPGQPLPG